MKTQHGQRFKSPSRNFSIAVAVTGFFLILCFCFPGFFRWLEAKWVDESFQLRGTIPTTQSIVIATIDEKSLTQLGRWPWPRSTMASLVERLTNMEVKAIGMDIVFAETSPEDSRLAEAIRNSPQTHLGYFFYTSAEEFQKAGLSQQEIEENEQSIFISRLSSITPPFEKGGAGGIFQSAYGLQSNVPTIATALESRRQGFFNVEPDSDGLVRSAPLVLSYKGNLYASLALELASTLRSFTPVALPNGLALGQSKIPLQKDGKFFINYRGPNQTFPHFSIADILSGKIPATDLKDKIVLVGATAIGIYDLRTTPFSANFPGVEIQANLLDNLLAGDFLITNQLTQTASYLLIILTGLLLGFLLPKFRAIRSAAVFLTLTASLLVSGYTLFIQWGWIVPVVKPALNGFFVFGTVTIYRYFTEEKERRKVKKAFQHYVSPAVIDQVLAHPEQLKLGGERKELTVLFSDIRDFTPKAERMAPERVVGLLNDYFTVMTEILFQHGATIDKFMGDAVMAIFGAPVTQPNHAERASQAAIAMVEALKKYQEIWKKKYGIEDLKIGIGIHTGTMAVGNMGSAKRFNYTVVGDAVNLASRLEGLTKEYNVPIIISDDHYRQIQTKVTAKELGTVQVKGKQQSTKIYSLSA